ncbi:MAG: hypothetical protein ACSW8J_03625 [bacterium]
MLVYFVAVIEMLFYLLAVPVRVMLRVKGLRAETKVTLFDISLPRKKRGSRKILHVIRNMRFDRIVLTGRVSLGDAAATALMCGSLEGLTRCLAGRVKYLRVEVHPVFSNELMFDIKGIIRARTGQIMWAALREMKGRIQPWTSIRLRAS